MPGHERAPYQRRGRRVQPHSDHALNVNSDAIAFAVLTYAYSTEDVNGVPGMRVPGNFAIPAPAGPEGTNAGGGLSFDEAS